MTDLQRLRKWLARAAPRRVDLVRALLTSSLASLAGSGLFVGAVALLTVSAQRPGLRAIGVFLIALELVAFLRSPLRFAERMSTHRLGFAAVGHWRQWLMTTVGNWPYSRWQRYGAGDLLERSLRDTDELQDLWLRGVIPTVATTITMLISDVAVAFLAPRGHWWPVALATLVLQALAISVLLAGLGAQVRADQTLRSRRGAYVAGIVSTRAAAPEIELLGESRFLQQRNLAAAILLDDAEERVRVVRRRAGAVVIVTPLAAIAVLGTAHPSSAPVWTIVATLIAVATLEALVTVRTAVHVAVAVTAGAERLDDLDVATPQSTGGWPSQHTLVLRDVVLQGARGEVRVDCTILPGRRVGVSGPSGVGKSTLLRTLAGLDEPGEGRVTVGGTALADIAEEELRRHLVLAPSEPGLLEGYVRDVLGMGASVSDDDLQALAKLGLVVGRNDHWTEISRGESQRVALVRALVRRPDILLLDEPTSALGEVETATVLELLSSLSATIVVASHDPRVLTWCDEVIELATSATP